MRLKNFVFSFILVLCSNQWVMGGIQQSHHDFTDIVDEICTPCHTPHNDMTDITDAPLWNHKLTAAVFLLYSSDTLNAIPGQPSGHSKLCLSCHDGTVAIDAYGGNSSGAHFVSYGKIGTDLRNVHPISFTYNSALAQADRELYDPSTTPSGLEGTIAEDLLQNGKMECTSCHDVHISRNTQGCAGCHVSGSPGAIGSRTETLSLWKSNANSALCLTCHIK